MKQFTIYLFAILVALTLSACAGATNPVIDHDMSSDLYSEGNS